METQTIKPKENGKTEQRHELITVLAEISNVTQRLAERLAYAEWQRSNVKEATK